MDLFVSSFESVAVLLAIGVLGFVIVARRVVPLNGLDVLAPLALDVAIPSLVLANILMEFRPSEFAGWWQLPLWWGGFVVFSVALTAVTVWLSRREFRREFAACLVYQNALFFPLAVISGIFGAGSFYALALFFFVMLYPSFLFSTAHLLFPATRGKIRWQRIFNPVLIATLFGLGLTMLGVQGQVPGFIVSAFRLVGRMSVPLLLLILGGSLYVDFLGRGRFQFFEVAKFVGLKNFVFPGVMLGLVWLVRPSHDVALMLMLQSMVPPVTAIPVIVERSGGDRGICNQYLLGSFVVSLISIPAMLQLFSMVYGG